MTICRDVTKVTTVIQTHNNPEMASQEHVERTIIQRYKPKGDQTFIVCVLPLP